MFRRMEMGSSAGTNAMYVCTTGGMDCACTRFRMDPRCPLWVLSHGSALVVRVVPFAWIRFVAQWLRLHHHHHHQFGSFVVIIISLV